ncbi:MAG: helix-turn-helix domain-containing protein [Lewinellaceae bacterium]|nr:helix-turn-helix domain-containing protein [Saprospiraceae bacterium]MCB9336888.1 helix-turn-helix domain-containing protein [Lewinellaceae bacterium]
MRYQYNEPSGGILNLVIAEPTFERRFFQEKNRPLNAILWNRGATQTLTVDGLGIAFPANHLACLMVNQSFTLERPQDVVIWQFNRDFYCIIDHDEEVSCVGFLFYGWKDFMLIQLSGDETRRFDLLLQVFREEFEMHDSIQGEMLRMLLKRLIIKLTRLAKTQFLDGSLNEPELDIVRQFNLLVENNYKKLRQVQDYAALLHKSPKTLSNLFSKYGEKSPLQIIQERVAMEGKRMLLFTGQSSSEIAYELGFEEPAHFSRFFKKMVGQSPSEFKLAAKNGG